MLISILVLIIHTLFPHTFQVFLFVCFLAEQLLDINEDAKLTAFEKAGIENYLHRNHMIAKNQIDVKVAATGERYSWLLQIGLSNLNFFVAHNKPDTHDKSSNMCSGT